MPIAQSKVDEIVKAIAEAEKSIASGYDEEIAYHQNEIASLLAGKQDALSALTQTVKTLCGVGTHGKLETPPLITKKGGWSNNESIDKMPATSIAKRVRSVLEFTALPEEFTTDMLFNETLKDGLGDIKKESFAATISKMVNKTKEIKIEKGSLGNVGGTYKRRLQASSPATKEQ